MTTGAIKPRSPSQELRLARRAYENAQYRLGEARREFSFAASRPLKNGR